jgi:hypothetical protein
LKISFFNHNQYKTTKIENENENFSPETFKNENFFPKFLRFKMKIYKKLQVFPRVERKNKKNISL